MGLYGLSITTDEYENILGFLETPKTVFDLMVKNDYGYTKAYQCLNVLAAAGEIKKVKTSAGRTVYVIK